MTIEEPNAIQKRITQRIAQLEQERQAFVVHTYDAIRTETRALAPMAARFRALQAAIKHRDEQADRYAIAINELRTLLTTLGPHAQVDAQPETSPPGVTHEPDATE